MPNTTSSQNNPENSAGVHAAYGAPVELDGTTIVPVALASYGYAGGTSDGDGERAAGGGGVAIPVGAYVTRDGYTRFEPNLISLLAVGIPFVCVAGRAIARIVKALKK